MAIVQLKKPDGLASSFLPPPNNAPYLVQITSNTSDDQRTQLVGTIISCKGCSSILSGNDEDASMINRLSGKINIKCNKNGCSGQDYVPDQPDDSGKPHEGDSGSSVEYLGVVHDAQFANNAIVSCQIAGLYTTMDGRSTLVNCPF